MDNSIFTGQFQAVMYKLMFSMLQKFSQKLDANGQSQSATSADTTATSTTTATGTSSTAVTGDFAALINQSAKKYNVNPNLVQAVVKAESNFNPSAVSSAGALGLMQLMPATAAGLGVSNALDPAQNIEGGVKFLSQLLTHFNGNVKLAVAAYNAGQGAVDRYNGVPPYQETQTYVERVLGYYNASNNSSSNTWQG
jgi:soluble lytic murein transglycosylase-like protein